MAKVLYDITMKEAIEGIADRLREIHGELSKAEAKKIIINTLIYECVVDEVLGQALFLMGEEV